MTLGILTIGSGNPFTSRDSSDDAASFIRPFCSVASTLYCVMLQTHSPFSLNHLLIRKRTLFQATQCHRISYVFQCSGINGFEQSSKYIGVGSPSMEYQEPVVNTTNSLCTYINRGSAAPIYGHSHCRI